MQDFISTLKKLTKHKDRYIKGSSNQLLQRLQDITDYLDKE